MRNEGKLRDEICAYTTSNLLIYNYNRNVVYYGVILELLFSSDKKAVLEETSTLQSDVNDVSAIIFATENDAPQPLDIKGKSWTISSYVINENTYCPAIFH